MLVNDNLYFQTFCKLLEAVVKAAGLEIPVENLQRNHFCFLSRKINVNTEAELGIQPATIRDYRYIYKKEKRFSVRQNRLDLMCVFLGYLGWNDFRSTHFNYTENIENNDDTVRLLILPDKRIGAIKKFEGQIADLINNRYEELKYELELDHLEITFENNLQSCPTGINKIRDLGESHQADLVVWPEYLHGKSPMMRIPSLLVNSDIQERKPEKQRYQKVENFAVIHDGAFLEATDILLFALLGIAAYKNGAFTKAKAHFKQVLNLDPNHSEAKSFMELLRNDQEEYVKVATTFELVTVAVTENQTIPKSTSKSHDISSTHEEFLGMNLPFQHEKDSLANHLLVLEGDNRVIKSKDLEPLVKSMLIHEDEPIIFLTSHTQMELMSMNDQNVFRLEAYKKEIPIKEALVTLEAWKPKHKSTMEKGDECTKWYFVCPPHLYAKTTDFTNNLTTFKILPRIP